MSKVVQSALSQSLCDVRNLFFALLLVVIETQLPDFLTLSLVSETFNCPIFYYDKF